MGRGQVELLPNLPLLASLVSQEPFSLPSLTLRLIASLLSSQGSFKASMMPSSGPSRLCPDPMS